MNNINEYNLTELKQIYESKMKIEVRKREIEREIKRIINIIKKYSKYEIVLAIKNKDFIEKFIIKNQKVTYIHKPNFNIKQYYNISYYDDIDSFMISEFCDKLVLDHAKSYVSQEKTFEETMNHLQNLDTSETITITINIIVEDKNNELDFDECYFNDYYFKDGKRFEDVIEL